METLNLHEADNSHQPDKIRSLSEAMCLPAPYVNETLEINVLRILGVRQT